jgi:23S rRNA-/tRNA-specific pseudouridylate synthase
LFPPPPPPLVFVDDDDDVPPTHVRGGFFEYDASSKRPSLSPPHSFSPCCRFVDANSYDWGGSVVPSAVDDEKNDFDYFDGLPYSTSGGEGAGGMTTDCGTNYNKPGVVVKRDDVAGYIIIDKPPNVPVHARVDNRLENVASCVGRMLWMERRRLRLRGEGGSDLDDADDAGGSCADDADGSTSSTAEASPDDDARQRRGGRRVNQRKQKVEPLVYVGTPQRLDQNTSGLLVVATRKSFASYFAGLLRSKTSGQLRGAGAPSPSCGVHKSYRCLVCILAPPGGDAANPLGGEAAATARSEMDRLERYSILRHFLEPSIRSPKRFESAVPDGAEDADSWAECLLRITRISEAHSVTVDAGPPSVALARSLWGEHGRPDECVAIAEIVVELLTGRTHQIRGQLAAEGFPLVGDVQYGGAVPNTSLMYRERCEGRAEGFLNSERLALQCCSLEFLDPRRGDDGLGTDSDNGPGLAMRSERWNSFRLDSAFWTSSLDQYTKDMAKLAPLGTKGTVTH